MTTLFLVIHFLYDSVIFLRERLKQLICQGRFYDNCPRGKLSLKPRFNTNPKPNLNSNPGVIFLEGNCPDTVKDTVFISQHLLQPSIITSGFISGKPLWPCSFKGTYFFHGTSCNNSCLKSTALNDECVNVLI